VSTTALPRGSREIVEHLTRMFPDLFVNDDEKQRQLTTLIGEQFAFTFGLSWGNKKRTGLSDDFRSKDSIAVQEDDGTISVWDMFSSGLDILVHDGDLPVAGSHANLPPSEAVFIPCEPKNHLGGNPLPGETPEPPSADLEARVESLEDFRATQRIVNEQTRDADDLRGRQIAVLTERIAKLEADVAKPLRVVGRTGDKYAHSHPIALEVQR
jgi:hypothetical protein